MVTKKPWEEFRKTGLLLFINQLLHIFGWAIVFEMVGDEVKNVYPARVKFRGFSDQDTDEAYKMIGKYMKDNSSIISDETNEF